MDEVKETNKKTKTPLAHTNEMQMTCKEHCHTTDTYPQLASEIISKEVILFTAHPFIRIH